MNMKVNYFLQNKLYGTVFRIRNRIYLTYSWCVWFKEIKATVFPTMPREHKSSMIFSLFVKALMIKALHIHYAEGPKRSSFDIGYASFRSAYFRSASFRSASCRSASFRPTMQN